jgi:N-methylhydantoinase A
VVGAQFIAIRDGGALDRPRPAVRAITFDMGGTSTDVSLLYGEPQVTTEGSIGGFPLRVPVLDIHTVGSGGGSIARVDPGGVLRVGPESAGADPGPACYGTGDQPTVTDANLVLGRLDPARFLGGEMPLDADRAQDALRRLGAALSMGAEQAALGVIEVVNAHMERALRVISVERGHDPEDFDLISFGGAGGLHAADLARGLGIPRVVVPPTAATFSAFGMLMADVVKDYTRTVMLPGDVPEDELLAQLNPLLERARVDLEAEGIRADRVKLAPQVDVRYRDQSYELTIPYSRRIGPDFHAAHEAVYGYADLDAPVVVVNVRVRAVGEVPRPELPRWERGGPTPPASALLERREVILSDGPCLLPFYRGEALLSGNRIAGPAVVVRSDTTILIAPQDQARMDDQGNLVIELGASGGG